MRRGLFVPQFQQNERLAGYAVPMEEWQPFDAVAAQLIWQRSVVTGPFVSVEIIAPQRIIAGLSVLISGDAGVERYQLNRIAARFITSRHKEANASILAAKGKPHPLGAIFARYIPGKKNISIALQAGRSAYKLPLSMGARSAKLRNGFDWSEERNWRCISSSEIPEAEHHCCDCC